MKHFPAPWARLLWFSSAFSTLICAAIAAGMLWSGRPILSWVALVPLAAILGAALFIVRGYVLTPDALHVRRLLWSTRLPLAGLQSVEVRPDAMSRSWRTFGNGGFFSITGWFRNQTLGTYRAFVTDPGRAVVLRFPGRTVVVSPSKPEDFAGWLDQRDGRKAG